MSSDLVEMLRWPPIDARKIMREAASRIETQADEIERLRNAIKEHRHRVDDLEEYDYGIGQAEYNLWAMLDGVDNEQ